MNRLTNKSHRPDAELVEMLEFVLGRLDLSDDVAILVMDAGKRSRGHYSGVAGDQRKHAPRKWAEGSRFRMRLTIPLDEWDEYGQPLVCWHSTGLRDLTFRRGGTNEALLDVAAMHMEGARTFGQWPIYTVNDWRECFVHLAAHEARHLHQYDREKPASEIDCERWAAWVLEKWRAAHGSPNLAGFCYNDAMTKNADVPKGSWWYTMGHHWEVVGYAEKEGEEAVVLRTPDSRWDRTVITRLFLRKATPSTVSPSDKSRYTIEGMGTTESSAVEGQQPGVTSAAGSAIRGDSTADESADQPTDGEEVRTMATATKERRKAAAATRASKAKVEVAATVDVKALERDLFDAVKAKGVTVKTEVKTGKSGLETVHVKNDSGTKLGLVDRYDNRLRVWVRKGGEYERLTVNDDKSVTKAAAALASRSK